MGRKPVALVVLLLACLSGSARAAVIVSEIFYNAPGDLDDLQWVELHNTDDRAADVGGWTLDQGKLFTLPAGTSIDAGGYVVVALNPGRFEKAYGSKPLGPMKRPLKGGGERIELCDATGKSVDVARYKDRSPWPVSADGYSASLERICPAAPGDAPDNWAASPLPSSPRPAGTPGKPNSSHSDVLPPVVEVDEAPSPLAPGQPHTVRARARGGAPARALTLLYRVLANGDESKETSLPMAKDAQGVYAATIPPLPSGALLRYRVRAAPETGSPRFTPGENDLRNTLSAYVHEPWEKAPVSFGLLILGRNPGPGAEVARFGRRFFGGPGFARQGDGQDRPPRGSSAFVFVEQPSGRTLVFDHVNTPTRGNHPGYKVYFHKDRPLHEMTAVSLVFEGSEMSLVVESLAYDVYRRAGNAAPLTEFVRLWVNGEPQGHHLIVERPNKAFLRRNKVDDHGNLYKILWFGDGVVGQHQKRTHRDEGHDDVVTLVEQLQRTSGNAAAQWAVIEKNFDVDQVATHFAVNMVLDHWDGFFNNYFTYHDTKRGKWQMYPWDHDKCWGVYDGVGDRPLVSIPLTFGMDTPGRARERGFNGGGWWRPPGAFSGPLLANPQFRKVFLARVRAVLDDVYTEERYNRAIDDLVIRLGDGEGNRRMLARGGEFLKAHVRLRRDFLLRQPELKNAGK
jgi:hypothetical protein